MARKRFTTEQIIGLLREAEVRLSQGQAIGTVCRSIGVSQQSYYRRPLGYRPPALETILPPASGLLYAPLRSAQMLADDGPPGRNAMPRR